MSFNQLTPAQAERLDLLAEECAEVIQAISKIKRHGYESRHPNGGPTNRRELEKELGQVLLASGMMKDHGDIDEENISKGHFEKLLTIDRWLHHNSVRSGIEAFEGSSE